MQRLAARWLALLAGITALSSGCIGGASEATPTRTTSEDKMDGSSDPHRSLHLPTVAPGAACPRTPGARPNPDVAIALGSGPAYPILGFEGNPIPPKPAVPLHAEDRKGNVYWHKTLWAVDPAYDGPVLIRGAGIDPPRAIWFAYARSVSWTLVSTPSPEVGEVIVRMTVAATRSLQPNPRASVQAAASRWHMTPPSGAVSAGFAMTATPPSRISR
jgi:hypothetical protein